MFPADRREKGATDARTPLFVTRQRANLMNPWDGARTFIADALTKRPNVKIHRRVHRHPESELRARRGPEKPPVVRFDQGDPAIGPRRSP
jgi:hypothetical protein